MSFGGLVVVGFALGFYFLPTIVAVFREHKQTTGIFILNLCLGRTVLGWVGALVWSVLEEKK